MGLPSLSTYGGFVFAAGYAGMIGDQGPAVIESFINNGSAAIDFGVAVARVAGNAPGQPGLCKQISADGDLICGITVKQPLDVASADGLNTVNFPQYHDVPVMKSGFVRVVAFEAVRAGDQVLSITAQNGKLGGSKSGVAGSGRVAVPNAVWQEDTGAGAVGLIFIDGGETGRTTT